MSFDPNPEFAPRKKIVSKKLNPNFLPEPWVLGLNDVFIKAGIRFSSEVFANGFSRRDNHTEGDNSDECGWVAHTRLNQDGKGFANPNGDGPFYNSYYFMTSEDLYAFQKQVMLVCARAFRCAELLAQSRHYCSTSPVFKQGTTFDSQHPARRFWEKRLSTGVRR